MTDSMLDHAVAYAQRGWPVFPLHHPTEGGCSCGDSGCGKNAGKHPRTRHGVDDATTDLEVIRAWWSRWPEANIGARTGIAFDVLDVDTPDVHDGTADWPRVEMLGGPVVRTGRGWHFYVLPTGLGNRARFAGPCDWRGAGGYVILPPSLHASGTRYEWHAPAALDVLEAPVELLDLLKPKPAPVLSGPVGPMRQFGDSPGRWNPTGLIGYVAMAPEGERNHRLNWAAHKVGSDVRQQLVDHDHAVAALDELEMVAIRIGLGEKEVERTIRSGYESGAGIAS